MDFLIVLSLWLASFAADNLWRVILPLTDTMTTRASYPLVWAVVVTCLVLAARWPASFILLPVVVGDVAALLILSNHINWYVYTTIVLRLIGVAACFNIMSNAMDRWSFAAAAGLAGGHALTLLSFLISRLAPIVSHDVGSQLAMRYGPRAVAVEALGCLLIMALAMAWAGRRGS